MRELIDRAALIAEYDRVHVGPPGGARKLMEDAPTIEERKKGKWIDNETSYADGVRQTCTCSICGRRSVRPLGRFCRWCGANMEGEK